MKSPFVFGKVVIGDSFVNRTREIERLSGNFRNHHNSILISPRRMGKSSLVKKTATKVSANSRNIRFCFLDLFRIRSEEEFYKRYAIEVIKSTSERTGEWVKNTYNFLGHLSPTFSFGVDPLHDFQINFADSSKEMDVEELLNLPEKIAKRKKIHIIVCIDEFQDIERFKDSLGFQRMLRSVWQYHQHTSYCLYGSKKQIMIELFEKQSMPFYKFGDVLFLNKIEKEHFVKFISDSFLKANKFIEEGFSRELIDVVDNHPYYVQQLAHIIWVNTTNAVTKNILEESINELIEQNSILYQQIVNSLSNKQINFLKALSKGVTAFNSFKVLKKHDIGTSGNVTKIKKVLVNKEIIDINGNISFLDPVFKLWFQKVFR